MSAYPEPLNVKEKALYLGIMWLENSPEYHEKVFCMDVDLDSGRVVLYGEQGLVREFNKKLEAMLLSISDPVDAWSNV
jgi:hypothetical protein